MNVSEDTKPDLQNQRIREIEVKPQTDAPMHGVLWVLSQKLGANPHKAGAVEITASSSEYNQPFDVVNENWDDYWYSKEEVLPWLCVNFKNIEIKPTHYVLKTFNCGPNYSHLKSIRKQTVLHSIKRKPYLHLTVLQTRAISN
jgi:hypothetical protein